MTVPLSILDLATIGKGQTAAESFAGSVAMAQRAEELGYRRIWYAEHHNMSSIASSATSVLIAHVAAHTSSIRLGAGGMMLPNHSPLTIAEQFGTLETLHPGRIDLGLGRAPGSDQNTMRALRRDPMSADSFPQDVLELQGYLSGPTRIQGVEATPGKGTNVPLYILGSSLFGARLAAQLGLPYAFASHFAPNALQDAVALYRREFRPSAQLDAPHVIAGVNVIAADSAAEAQADVPGHQARPGFAVLRQRPRVHRRRGGHDPGLAAGPAHGADDEVLGHRHPRCRDRVPGGVHGARRRRRTDRGAPEHRHRSPAALRGTSGRRRRGLARA